LSSDCARPVVFQFEIAASDFRHAKQERIRKVDYSAAANFGRIEFLNFLAVRDRSTRTALPITSAGRFCAAYQ